MEKTKHVSYRRWASWCHPCGVENKELANIYSEFKSSGFEIIGIAMDNDRFAWLNAILTDSSSWINLCDFKLRDGDAAKQYIWNTMNDAYTLPQNVLIDKNGIIIRRNLQPDELRKILLKL